MEEIVLNKNKIKINNQVVAVLMGIIISLTTILYVNADSNDPYNPSGSTVIDVGGSEMTLHVKFAGSKPSLKSSGNANKKKDFKDASRPVDIWAAEYSGALSVGIEKPGGGHYTATNKKRCHTELNAGDGYNIINFQISYIQPAHKFVNSYYDEPSKTNRVAGGCDNQGTGRFTIFSDGANGTNSWHEDKDHWVTLNVSLNLSNTGMVSDDNNKQHFDTKKHITFGQSSYTVSLYDSVNNTSSSQNVECGGSAWLPSPSAPGYTFNGWYEGNTRYDGNSNLYVCSGDRSLSAGYTAQSHYVTFDTQGGTFPSSLKSQTELNGCKIIPNGIYSIKSNCGSNKYIHVYGAGYNQTKDKETAICIYSTKGGSQTQWVIERYKNTQYYTITSYHNGLALSLSGAPTNNQPGTGQQGKQLELWSMEKDIIDYQWYFKENNGHLEIYNRSTDQCLDVYNAGTADATPIWQYNANHSYAQWWDFEPVVQTDYPFKLQYANYNLLTPSISPQRGVDKFLGWSTDKNATSPTYYANSVCNIYGNSNVTLYAIYQARATVSYDANGGSNASLPKPQTVDVGSKITLASAGTMGRDNYVFLGWSTDPHATKNYDPADSEVTVSSSGNVVYYAIWKNATGNADLSNVITGDGMFTNDTELEGQNGTTYNSIHDGLDYAKPDGGVDDPGYYIEK